jgi:hypothetical protein
MNAKADVALIAHLLSLLILLAPFFFTLPLGDHSFVRFLSSAAQPCPVQSSLHFLSLLFLF